MILDCDARRKRLAFAFAALFVCVLYLRSLQPSTGAPDASSLPAVAPSGVWQHNLASREALVFLQYPKAGGTSLNHLLGEAFEASTVCYGINRLAGAAGWAHLSVPGYCERCASVGGCVGCEDDTCPQWVGGDPAATFGTSSWDSTGFLQAVRMPWERTAHWTAAKAPKPLSACRLLIGDHYDFSLARQIELRAPKLQVRLITIVRRPVSVFFSAFYFMRYCVPYQRHGIDPPPGRGYNASLDITGGTTLAQYREKWPAVGAHVFSLVKFFAGTARALGCGRLAAPRPEEKEEAAAARRNAARFAMIGFLEDVQLTMRLLQDVLGLPFTPTLPRANRCSGFVPTAADNRTQELEAELEGGVLARDTALFNELWAEFQERTARWLR